MARNATTLPLQKLLEGNYIRVMEMHEDFHRLSPTPHRHDHYELLYVTEGEGQHLIDFREFKIKPGRVYFLHPGQVHVIGHFRRRGWLIMFGPEVYRQFTELHPAEQEGGLFDSYSAQPFIDLDARLTDTLRHTLAQIQQESLQTKIHTGILFHQVAALLLQANRAYQVQHPKSPGSSANWTEFYRLKQLLESHFKQQHLAAFYALKMQADIKKLNRICRTNTGLSVAGLLKERLLTESKVLLHTSTASVKEISYQLGFNDPAFFGRFFKRETGLSPATFRDQRLL